MIYEEAFKFFNRATPRRSRWPCRHHGRRSAWWCSARRRPETGSGRDDDAPTIACWSLVRKAKRPVPRIAHVARPPRRSPSCSFCPAFWWLSLALRQTASIPVNVSLWETWVPANSSFFENLSEAFRLYPMGAFFVNSIIVATAVTLGEVLFASMAGFGLAKYRFLGHRAWCSPRSWCSCSSPRSSWSIPLFDLAASLGLVNSFPAFIVPFLVTPFGIFLMRQLMLDIPE